MTQDEFSEFVLKLHELSRKQLEEVRRQCAGHLQSRSGNESVPEQDWILSGILDELRARGLEKEAPHNFRIKGHASFASYETKSARIRDLLNEAIPNMSVIEQKSLGSIAARELADYISDWSEISLNSMLHNVGRIPQAIDAAFPAYISSGCLGAIFRKGVL